MRRYYFNPLIESLMQETKPLETILMPLQMYMERVRGLVTLSEATICSMYVIYAVHKRYEPIYEEGHPLRFKHEGDSLLEDLGAEALRHTSKYNALFALHQELSQIDNVIFEDNYPAIILYLSNLNAEAGGLNTAEFYTTREVTALMAMLTRHTGCRSVYDPFCGTAAITHLLCGPERDCTFKGQDISPISCLFARVNKEIATGTDEGIVNADSFQEWDASAFDAVVSCPPINMKVDKQYLEQLSHNLPKATRKPNELIVSRGFNINGARMVMLLDGLGFCYRGNYDAEFRRYLVDNNLLEMIIALPGKLLYGTSIQSVIYMCRSDREEGRPVLFVDAHELTPDNGIALSDVIYNAIVNRDSRYCSPVPVSEVIGNDYNLLPAIYSRKITKPQEGQSVVRLSDLIEYVPGKPIRTSEKSVNVNSTILSDDFITVLLNRDKDASPMVKRYGLMTARSYAPIPGETYLIVESSHISINRNRIALRTDGKEFLSAHSTVYRINENLIRPDYLAYRLTTEPFLKQGQVALENCMSMKFVIDSKKRQEEIVSDVLRQYDEETRRSREADAERLGIKKNISDLEHMLGTTQMRIDEIISLLSEMAPEDNSYQKTVKALKDNFEYMNRMIKYSNSQICSEQMNLKEGDLSEYILGYADGWRNYGGNYFRLEVVDNLPKGLAVVFDRVMLTVMLDSILSNAVRHGFHKRKNYTDDNKVEIGLDVVRKDLKPYVLIKVSNNGDPMAEGFTIKDFISRGRFASGTGRSGLGGYHVHQIAKGHGGYLSLDSTKVWNMIVDVLIPLSVEADETMEEYENECV